MLAETLSEVGGEAVIDRTAVGNVSGHIAEGDAVSKAAGGAGAVSTYAIGLQNWGCQRQARCEGAHERWIEAGGTEETDQGGRDPRLP